jgi:hypothetical protein
LVSLADQLDRKPEPGRPPHALPRPWGPPPSTEAWPVRWLRAAEQAADRAELEGGEDQLARVNAFLRRINVQVESQVPAGTESGRRTTNHD